MREILSDEELNEIVYAETGKNLAVIEAGAQITTPAARIILSGGNYTRASNTRREIEFTIEFYFPFWGSDAFERCLKFLDETIPIFFKYGSGKNNQDNYILQVTPSITEEDEETETWTVALSVTVSIFI
ncbi:MAG: hypothetical protein IJU48_02740 [Synergistaceae bacterium]|nr:hypothetical protein [Synergistaceae bacterium]